MADPNFPVLKPGATIGILGGGQLGRMLALVGDLRKLFNTSGLVYKELKLSQKLPEMTEKEALALLPAEFKGRNFEQGKALFEQIEGRVAPARVKMWGIGLHLGGGKARRIGMGEIGGREHRRGRHRGAERAGPFAAMDRECVERFGFGHRRLLGPKVPRRADQHNWQEATSRGESPICFPFCRA